MVMKGVIASKTAGWSISSEPGREKSQKKKKKTVQNENETALESGESGRVGGEAFEKRLRGEILPVEQSTQHAEATKRLGGSTGENEDFAGGRDDSALLGDLAGRVGVVAGDNLDAVAIVDERLDRGARRRLQRTVEQQEPAERQVRLDGGARHRLQLSFTSFPVSTSCGETDSGRSFHAMANTRFPCSV